MVVEDVARFLGGVSVRTVHERAVLQIPHRRIGGTRRLLFLEAELVQWIDGCELEVVETANGGRAVRPKAGS
jgi:hypothetical protein